MDDLFLPFQQRKFRNQFLTQASRLISLYEKPVVNGGEFRDQQFFEVDGTVPGCGRLNVWLLVH